MHKRLYIILLLTLFSGILWAQNGTIDGKIIDNRTKETIIGANVIIEGTTVGSSTDVDGNFAISNLKPGTYIINVSYVTYKTQIISDVVVEAGKRTTLEISLLEDVAELAEVLVVAKKETSTDFSLINGIKAAKLVVSGISADQIVKMPDRDAAQVMQRMPGVTIADNRFVLIRGVPDRYNQVMINGIIAPSTEIDKRSFSFDLVPAGAIDQMLVFKSGAAELPGDFAGGVIQLVTKQPSFEPSTKVGLNFGFRGNTTFKDFLASDGSSTDAFGFDNGFRDLPSDFPTSQALQASARTSTLREAAGKSLTNNFAYNKTKAPVDMGINFSTNNNFSIGSLKFSNLTSMNYSNSYKSYQRDFFRYAEFTNNDLRFQYLDNFYSNDVRLSALHNWNIEINPNNRIEFKNMFVQLGEHETTIRTGDDKYQNPNFDRTNYAYHYLSRTIYTGQLEGSHIVDQKLKLTWALGTNLINRNEPDFRRFRTFRDKDFANTEEPFQIQLPPSGNIFETGRFWSSLKDRGYSNSVGIEWKPKSIDEKRVFGLKGGYYVDYKTRSFSARSMNYLYPGNSDPMVGQQLIKLPLSDIFSPANIKAVDGFVVEDGTTNKDSYTGKNLLFAGYINSFIPVGKFDLSVGFRGEYNNQQLESKRDDGTLLEVNNPIFAPLPFLNVAYNLTDRSLVRLAYSRTVNRPEFRELAPFLYYQFEWEAAIYGNENLSTAFIHNIDARWEMYPNPGETISIGAFAKQFKDPIELNVQVTTDNPQFNFRNASQATSFGTELEFRKSLADLGLNRIVRNMSVNLNAAYIWSQIDIGNSASTNNQARYRPLQGQSPYIINAGLYYFDDVTGVSVNTAYNVFGPRIFSVGDINYPTWWEKPRHSVDIQLAKSWLEGRYEVKLNVQNVLNATYRIFQDSNLDNKISGNEPIVQNYKSGTLFTLGLVWKIK